MADFGVLHEGIDAGGGAEAVGLHTVSALADAGHDVTLYTTGAPDIRTLADDFDLSLPASVRVRSVRTPTISAVNHAATLAQPLGVTDFPLLRTAVFERVVARRYQNDHDRLVCTHGEFQVGGAVEYVHFPYFAADAMEQYDTRFEESLYAPYHRVCRALKYRESDARVQTLTNSEWTAGVLRETLDADATVVHPPVAVEAFDPPPWAEREAGFVAVGRLHPLKRQQELVDVVARLRERGIDTHLHLVGGDGSAAYADRLRARARQADWLHVEGRVGRDRLVSLLEAHRYAIHGRRYEHFGIAVAEALAAGCLPFVHASGGQQEIVAGLDALRYEDVPDAVSTTASVLASPDTQVRLCDRLDGRAARYGRDRFQREMCAAVEATLQ
jgi:glycosyltransferase involved in cell wall biosynthesis